MRASNPREIIQLEANRLGPTLHAGVSTALAGARMRNAGLQHRKYPHLIPTHLRVELREYLELNPLPSGWTMGGDARKMGQLLFHHPELSMELRFLKERRRTYPLGVPPAGNNKTRREVWTDVPFEGLHVVRPKGKPVQLLLLWDFLEGDLDRFTLRVVHTVAPGIYGKPVPCDLILDVRDGGEIYKRLEFTGSPDEEDLFAVEIDQEENESGS